MSYPKKESMFPMILFLILPVLYKLNILHRINMCNKFKLKYPPFPMLIITEKLKNFPFK